MSSSLVSLAKCTAYDKEQIYTLLQKQFSELGITKDFFFGKKVVIKPNLVSARNPDKAATVHPAVLSALGKLIKTYSPSSLIIAESPGAPFTEMALKSVYRACETDKAAAEAGIPLNLETKSRSVRFPEGKMCREFQIIESVAEADVVVNLCKLKTHSLTKMTCATKNFFGVVPGVQKFEMHARFPDPGDFQEMIVDLAQCICQSKEILCVCDAIYGMEGNGPSNGIPRKFGALLLSRSPFALDVAAEYLLGFEGSVRLSDIAAERGLVSRNLSEIELSGDSIDEVRITDCRLPDTEAGWILKNLPHLFGGKLANYFKPRPLIDNKKCIGCGKCRESCPVHTIEIRGEKGNKKAFIHKQKCIRCFCCQELCPYDAVKIKKNILIRIAH